jgi:hypothetical protein
MQCTSSETPSLRLRLLLYLGGLAAIAIPWGYLLFIRPWQRAQLRPTSNCVNGHD